MAGAYTDEPDEVGAEAGDATLSKAIVSTRAADSVRPQSPTARWSSGQWRE